MKTNVLRGFISIFGAKVVTLFLGLLVTPILVRLLGISQYGDYAFLLSVLGITMILANAGIFDGTRKYIAEDREQSNWTEHVFGFYFRVAIILAVLTALVYVVFSALGLSDYFFDERFSTYFYLLGILVISRQADSIARGGLMGLGFEDRSEPLSILKNVLFAICGLSLAYIGYGVEGVLVGHIIASLVTSIFSYFVLFQHISVRAIFSRVSTEFPKQELLSFNSFSIILILLTSSLYHADIIILRLIEGNESTGYYKAALVIAEFLWFVPNALQMVLLHSSSELWSKDRMDQITMLASKTTRYNLSLVLLLAIGVAALANDFVPLYFGSEFEASVLPLLLLLPGVVGFALARPIFAVGQGKGDLRVLIVATGTAAMINLALNLLLIPRYGMSGAAVATSIGYGSMVAFHGFAARRIGYDPFMDLRVFRIATTAILAAFVIFGFSRVIDSGLLSLAIVPPIGFVVYSTLALRTDAIAAEEIIPLLQRAPSPLSGWSIKVVRHIR